MSRFIGPGNKVPFISQLDDVIDDRWQYRFCGIVSVYMVLTYWWKQQSIPHYPSLDTVSAYGLDTGAYRDEIGWLHAKLADVARHYDYESIARSWLIREGDINSMRNQGRAATGHEVKRYVAQVEGEFIHSLQTALKEEVPVILSVKPKFGNNGGNHLVVITGISEDATEVTVHDPQTHIEDANMVVSMSRLLEYSNYNAIFIYT